MWGVSPCVYQLANLFFSILCKDKALVHACGVSVHASGVVVHVCGVLVHASGVIQVCGMLVYVFKS